MSCPVLYSTTVASLLLSSSHLRQFFKGCFPLKPQPPNKLKPSHTLLTSPPSFLPILNFSINLINTNHQDHYPSSTYSSSHHGRTWLSCLSPLTRLPQTSSLSQGSDSYTPLSFEAFVSNPLTSFSPHRSSISTHSLLLRPFSSTSRLSLYASSTLSRCSFAPLLACAFSSSTACFESGHSSWNITRYHLQRSFGNDLPERCCSSSRESVSTSSSESLRSRIRSSSTT